ncbi:MAG TPA: hypothetical protein VFM18_02200, partial [Methanosarcina sp.]|nr:hypothetical protein [Methanosarcina sp.]
MKYEAQENFVTAAAHGEMNFFQPDLLRRGLSRISLPWRLLTLVLLFSDAAMIALSFRVAYLIRFQSFLP